MTDKQWVKKLFATIDAKDTDAFVSFLTDDAVFAFANTPPVSGKSAIRDTLVGFFGSIKALRHEIADSWILPDVTFVIGRVTYTRHDGSTLSVPFADVLKTKKNLVSDYLIYLDASRLYAP